MLANVERLVDLVGSRESGLSRGTPAGRRKSRAIRGHRQVTSD